jgi:hypothetical protein
LTQSYFSAPLPFHGWYARTPPRQIISPTRFTDAQYERLALLYVAASARRGAWLIPALHGAVDYGVGANAHDDPQHFDIGTFAAQVQKLLNAIWSTNAAPEPSSFPAPGNFG